MKPDHVCPVCGGCGCVPCDDRGGKAHFTKPCPQEIGCNGSGKVSAHKFKWIKEKTESGKIFCNKCNDWHKVCIKES